MANGMSNLEMQNNMINKATEQLQWASSDEDEEKAAAKEFFLQINRLRRFFSGNRKTLIIAENAKIINKTIFDLKNKTKKTRQDIADLKHLNSKVFIDSSIFENGAAAISRAPDYDQNRFDMWGQFLKNRLDSPTKNKKLIRKILQELSKIFQTALNAHNKVTRKLHDSWVLSAQTMSNPALKQTSAYMSASLQERARESLNNTIKGSKEEKAKIKKLSKIGTRLERDLEGLL